MQHSRISKMTKLIALLIVLAAGAAPVGSSASDDQTQHAAPRAVKVLIITLFKPEADAWAPLALTQDISVPGLSPDYPNVRCNADDVCLLTTGMGHTNAATSTAAVVLSGKFDLSHTYFLISGIAGINPELGTIGSAAWARYLVDYGIAHEIDAREMPAGWADGYFGTRTSGPGIMPPLDYRNEVFQLNEALLQRALALSVHVKLKDSPQAAAYRTLYSQAAAKAAPTVIQCDTVAGDTYWHGTILGRRATQWTALLTQGKGNYCTTQQEENAVLEALRRGSSAKLLDVGRVADLRTGANFDRPHDGQTPLESLKSESGGFQLATANIYLAGFPLVQDIVRHWDSWRSGVPK
jgi:purine nucleoside permease